jgi:thiol:disulfide interchange protein/DsbC/DsbD-like thiol-disulfide interchange protein
MNDCAELGAVERAERIMNKASLWFLPLALVLFAQAPGLAAQPVRTDNIEAELVAATDAVVPGQPLVAGLRLKHDEHWHTYWQVPGDSGLPTRIQWKLPPGWTAGPIEWPLPQRLPVGPLMNFGYEGEVLLLTTLKPPPNLTAGSSVSLTARGEWLICKDVCIPGGADLKLELPVRDSAGPGRRAALFASMRARVPAPIQLDGAEALIESNRIRLSFVRAGDAKQFDFFPLEEGRIEPAAKQPVTRAANRVVLSLTAAEPVAADFNRLKGVLVAEGGPANADRGGWAGAVDIPLKAGSVAIGATAGATSSVAGAVVDEGSDAAPVTFWIALVGAFVGGLILNLMPCVFPVLSLKLVSLLQHRRPHDQGHGRLPLARHGVAFICGVVLSFVLLAALMIGLRAGGAQLGWGFQLQSPWVIAALTALFFLIGLNLLGSFEFTLGSGVASSRTARELQDDRPTGSFWTGVLAVVVAAPCTAPFMGAAMGYAVTQPGPIAITLFATLGVGMATPYLLLTVFPQVLARLPRPGAWMERFKQLMAFPMFATCVWLLWVLSQQVDENGVAGMLGALVLFGMAAWSLGLAQRGAKGFRWVAAFAAGFAVYALVAATGQYAVEAAQGSRAKVATNSAWQPWSADAVERELSVGRPVFVDFTAAWCVTCQANKRLVLSRGAVTRALADKRVVLMRADWTNRDPAITQELARFKRNGVPLYVLYDGKGRARILPELLTENTVLTAVGSL